MTPGRLTAGQTIAALEQTYGRIISRHFPRTPSLALASTANDNRKDDA